MDGGKAVAYACWRFDQRVIDGLVNGVAGLIRVTGGKLRYFCGASIVSIDRFPLSDLPERVLAAVA